MNPYLKNNRHYGKHKSLAIVAITYLLAGLVAVGGYQLAATAEPFWSVFFADLLATVVVWSVGMLFRNASLYDPYWSVVPPLVVLFAWSLSSFEVASGPVLMTLVVMAWSIRLTSNWGRDWPGLHHEDWRYQELRRRSGTWYPLVNLLGICGFPTGLVFLGLLPVWPVLASGAGSNLFLDVVAWLVGMSAVVIQLIADEQMRGYRFKKTAGQPPFYSQGLWAWSRHPNYFGEVVMWFSLWLFAISAGWGNFWTGIGWIAMLGLFLFVSCPWMDRRCAEKRPGYAAHMQNSNRLLMTPPRKPVNRTEG